MGSEHSTDRPPKRTSTRRFAVSGADSKKVDSTQEQVLGGLRDGLMLLVDRFFDDARQVVRSELLKFGLDLYNEGSARGAQQAAVLYRAYVVLLEQKYAAMVRGRDARIEVTRPDVGLTELRNAISATGVDATLAEVEKQCADLSITITKDEA